MRSMAILLLAFTLTADAGTFTTGGPVTTDNDAGCDISNLPAATLLLPYFEVDIDSLAGTGETTIFTVINTGNLPQIAHVTLWTDLDYPVLDFNLYLTGYDAQSINLYDVIRRGVVAPDYGTGPDVSPVGDLSGTSYNRAFDNPLVDESSCNDQRVQLDHATINYIQAAFTMGRVPGRGTLPACAKVGGAHLNAVGYATIDVVGECENVFPTDLDYYGRVIRFDNVLSGDYHQINGDEDFAQGGPLVHIRAIPEGGTPKERAENQARYKVNFTRTFYARYQTPTWPGFDGRQPLPATFVARWIEGGSTGYDTFFKVWREGRSPSGAPCSAFAKNTMNMIELVRFDEEENPTTIAPYYPVCTPIIYEPVLPVTSLVDAADDSVFPPNHDGAIAGWMYMNLDYCNQDTFAGQNWVISSMRAEERFSVDIEALALGNGCSWPIAESEAYGGIGPIGPAPNSNR